MHLGMGAFVLLLFVCSHTINTHIPTRSANFAPHPTPPLSCRPGHAHALARSLARTPQVRTRTDCLFARPSDRIGSMQNTVSLRRVKFSRHEHPGDHTIYFVPMSMRQPLTLRVGAHMIIARREQRSRKAASRGLDPDWLGKRARSPWGFLIAFLLIGALVAAAAVVAESFPPEEAGKSLVAAGSRAGVGDDVNGKVVTGVQVEERRGVPMRSNNMARIDVAV